MKKQVGIGHLRQIFLALALGFSGQVYASSTIVVSAVPDDAVALLSSSTYFKQPAAAKVVITNSSNIASIYYVDTNGNVFGLSSNGALSRPTRIYAGNGGSGDGAAFVSYRDMLYTDFRSSRTDLDKSSIDAAEADIKARISTSKSWTIQVTAPFNIPSSVQVPALQNTDGALAALVVVTNRDGVATNYFVDSHQNMFDSTGAPIMKAPSSAMQFYIWLANLQAQKDSAKYGSLPCFVPNSAIANSDPAVAQAAIVSLISGAAHPYTLSPSLTSSFASGYPAMIRGANSPIITGKLALSNRGNTVAFSNLCMDVQGVLYIVNADSSVTLLTASALASAFPSTGFTLRATNPQQLDINSLLTAWDNNGYCFNPNDAANVKSSVIALQQLFAQRQLQSWQLTSDAVPVEQQQSLLKSKNVTMVTQVTLTDRNGQAVRYLVDITGLLWDISGNPVMPQGSSTQYNYSAWCDSLLQQKDLAYGNVALFLPEASGSATVASAKTRIQESINSYVVANKPYVLTGMPSSLVVGFPVFVTGINKSLIASGLSLKNRSGQVVGVTMAVDSQGYLYAVSGNNYSVLNGITGITLAGAQESVGGLSLTALLTATDQYGIIFNPTASTDINKNFNALQQAYNQKLAQSWRIAIAAPAGTMPALTGGVAAVAQVTLTDRDAATTIFYVGVDGNVYAFSGAQLSSSGQTAYAAWLKGLTSQVDVKYDNKLCFVGDNKVNGMASAASDIQAKVAAAVLMQKLAQSWRIAIAAPAGTVPALMGGVAAVAQVTLTDRDAATTKFYVGIDGNVYSSAGAPVVSNGQTYSAWVTALANQADSKYSTAQTSVKCFVGDNNANGMALAVSGIQALVTAAVLKQKLAQSWRIAIAAPAGTVSALTGGVAAVAQVTLADRDAATTSFYVGVDGNVYTSAGVPVSSSGQTAYADWVTTLANQVDSKYGTAQTGVKCFVGDNNANGMAAAAASIKNLIEASILKGKQVQSWRIVVTYPLTTTPSALQGGATVLAGVQLIDRDGAIVQYWMDSTGTMFDANGVSLNKNYSAWVSEVGAQKDAKYSTAQDSINCFVGDNNVNGLSNASGQLAAAINAYANNYVYRLTPDISNGLTSAPTLVNGLANPFLLVGLSLNNRANQGLLNGLAIDTQGGLYILKDGSYAALTAAMLSGGVTLKSQNPAQLQLAELLAMTDQSGPCFASGDATMQNFKNLQAQYAQQQQTSWNIAVTANVGTKLATVNGAALNSVAQVVVTGRMGEGYQLPASTANPFIFPGTYMIDVSGRVYYQNGSIFTVFNSTQLSLSSQPVAYTAWINNLLAKQVDLNYGGVACFTDGVNNPNLKAAISQIQALVAAARLKTSWSLVVNPAGVALPSGIVAALGVCNRGLDTLSGTGYAPGIYFVGLSGKMYTSAGYINVSYSTWLTNLAKQQAVFPEAPSVKTKAFATGLTAAFTTLKGQIDNSVKKTHAAVSGSLVIGGYQP